jgi:UDP-N-acetylglucosamine 1-carboxyvinyltransferase
MSKFIIQGGLQLSGEIRVSGAKNSVLPLMAASLLTQEKCVLKNVPAISDVASMVSILRDLGSDVIYEGDVLTLQAKNVDKVAPAPALVLQFRASILLLGALVARCGSATLPYPGGDRIGVRPLDAHFEAFRALGITVSVTDNIKLEATQIIGGKIVLEETSVTATENAMLAAVLGKGKTVIKLAAMEPHVQQLGNFLNLMGADISGIGTPTLTIVGVQELHGAEITIIPDSEEAASLITLAAANKGHVLVREIDPDFLEDYLLKLRKMQVSFRVDSGSVEVRPPESSYQATKIQCGLYPKLNSDYLPPMAVLATQAEGETMMYEWMYEDRLGYVSELQKMGARAEILDPHRVRIQGPTKLYGQKITTYDLRMGITLVIAALVAEGQSEIADIHHIDRGYANLEQRLRGIGADIKRIEE